MAFSVNEVVRAAFQSRGKAMQEKNLCSQGTITWKLQLDLVALSSNNYNPPDALSSL